MTDDIEKGVSNILDDYDRITIRKSLDGSIVARVMSEGDLVSQGVGPTVTIALEQLVKHT